MKKGNTRSSSVQDTEPSNRKASKRSRNEDALWDCTFCTFKNKPGLAKCSICNVPRGSSTRKPRLNQVAQQFANIESQIEQERKKEQRKEIQKTSRTTKRSSVSSTSNSNLTGAQTLSITVKGITVFMTEYEVSNCSSSTTTNVKAPPSITNDAGSDNDTNNNDTIDETTTKQTDSESEIKTENTMNSDDDQYEKSNCKKSTAKCSKNTPKNVKTTTNENNKNNMNKRKFNTSKTQDTSLTMQSKKSKKANLNTSFDSSFDSEERQARATKKPPNRVESSDDAESIISKSKENLKEKSHLSDREEYSVDEQPVKKLIKNKKKFRNGQSKPVEVEKEIESDEPGNNIDKKDLLNVSNKENDDLAKDEKAKLPNESETERSSNEEAVDEKQLMKNDSNSEKNLLPEAAS